MSLFLALAALVCAVTAGLIDAEVVHAEHALAWLCAAVALLILSEVVPE